MKPPRDIALLVIAVAVSIIALVQILDFAGVRRCGLSWSGACKVETDITPPDNCGTDPSKACYVRSSP